jgi:hypothetical protein
MLRVDTSSVFIIQRKCNNTDVESGHKQCVHCLCPLSTSVLLHFLGMVNKLLVSTLNICIVTFPWDGEQTACVHSQHLFCYISLGWWTNCLCPLSTSVLLHFLGMMNKLLVSTLNICIVTFPWDDEHTACVHSQHLYCYISLEWWTNCLCPLSTSVLLHFLGMVNKLLVSTLNIFSSQGNVTIKMLRVDTSSLFTIPRKCNNTDVESGHKQFVHHPKEM